MARSVVLRARVVSFEHSEYAPFTDNSGRLVQGGVSHRIWAVDDHHSAPVRIDVSAELFEKLAALDDPSAFGQELAFTCQVFANGRNVKYRLVTVETPGVRAPAKSA